MDNNYGKNSIYQFELEKWKQHQSKFTKFLSVLDKNRNEIQNTDLYVLKLLQLNKLLDSVEIVLDDIKYECIYPHSKFNDHKKIRKEINDHLKAKQFILSCLKK
jgi:hypothetical protein